MLAGLMLLWAVAAVAAEGALPVDRWLVLGPAPAPLPALHDEKAGEFSLKELLSARSLARPDLSPRAGDTVAWGPGTELRWQEMGTAAGSPLKLAAAEGIQAAYLAAYLRVPRFVSLELSVRSHHPVLVRVDGAEVATKAGSTPAPANGNGEPEDKTRKKKGKATQETAGQEEPGSARADLDLEPGVHRILIRALRDPGCALPWTVGASVGSEDGELPAGLALSASPEHPLELAQVLDAPRPTAVTISPDGELAAVTLARVRPGTDESESWVEVRRTRDGSLERSYRGAELSRVDWAPRGRRLSYVTRDDKVASLWVADLGDGTVQAILEGVEKLGSYRWSPDAASVIYAVSADEPEDELGVQRLWNLQDRQAGWRNRSYLHQVFLAGGARRRLTAGELSTSLSDISPDSRRLLFTRSVSDTAQRPFLRSELRVLDLETLETEVLDPGRWLRSARWSPDGKRLLVVAGPSAFGGAGAAVAEGSVPNDYDNQLYLLDPDSRDVTPLSRDFDPAVGRAVWHRDGNVYLSATEGSRVRFYRLDPEARTYTPLDAGVEVVARWDVSRDASLAVLIGSGAVQPPRVSVLDLARGRSREILAPGAEAFRDVKLGRVEPWSFESRRGATIEGRVYYPPDFDPEGRYPAIVYYYGGTSPVTRDFGGRYPKNWWAAHGYVVYVLQPSGAVGYGQEFSALHVNDWGPIAGDDILEGVERFLEAHPFVDGERLGCLGASYGGFMTQYLLTRTERFAAGISHAGISSLGSYWGEGYWGYAYSAVATAGSFPWNRGDLYVGHSPLFNADKIRTPLLLLHGDSDTNVPPGESEQLYTALKLLERPVEYVRIKGQDHWILKHAQRVHWSRTILAWFDRWLKDEPQWWDHLYPGPGGPAKD
jgi:dipeptidyl aminopeptidase/acylaminoacyl peptidase